MQGPTTAIYRFRLLITPTAITCGAIRLDHRIGGDSLLGGTSPVTSTSLVTSRVSAAVASVTSLAVGALSLALVPALADTIFSQAIDRFLSLGVTHAT